MLAAPPFDAYPDALATLTPWNTARRAVVGHVHDGDTMDLRIGLGFSVEVYEPIRVQGCNAPELGTPAGIAARDFVRGLLPPGTAVIVMTTPAQTQSFVRYVGRVYYLASDGSVADLTATLLAGGYAVPEPGSE